MSAAIALDYFAEVRRLPLPIDPATIAPEEWQYLADLIPKVFRPERAPRLYDTATRSRLRTTRKQHTEERERDREQDRRALEHERARNPPPTFSVSRTGAEPKQHPSEITSEITPEARRHVDIAVASINCLIANLRPEDRFEWKQDLKQDLLIKLWDGRLRPEAAGIKVAARNETFNMLAHRSTERSKEREYAAGIKKSRIGRRGPNWRPTWYAPTKKAEEMAPFAQAKGKDSVWRKVGQFAPFTCHGARLMHVKAFSGCMSSEDSAIELGQVDIETAMNEFIDSRREPDSSSR